MHFDGVYDSFRKWHQNEENFHYDTIVVPRRESALLCVVFKATNMRLNAVNTK
jgi:hypothetical protein